MKALDARNKMAHTYNFKTFEEIITAVRADYLVILDELHMEMMGKALDENSNA